jgi:trigger factor
MTVEVIEGLKRKATFSINKSDVQDTVKTELKKYAKDAKAPGFRVGKVPHNILDQMYGGKAFEDALNDQINKKFVSVITENKLDLAGYPDFELTNKEDKDAKEFIFSAIFEVMPEIKIGELSSYEVEKPFCNVDDSVIEKTINSLRAQRAIFNDANKAAENTDKVTIDFLGTVDGVEFDGGKAENYPFILGQGYMLPDFETGVIGLNIGETREVKVNFPAEYHAENLKGKLAVFNITLKKVEAQVLPELNEDFIQSIGVQDGNLDTLKKEVKDNISREVKRRIHAKTRDNTLKALSDSTSLEVPYAMVHDEIHHMMDTTTENMKKQGYQADQIKLTHDMFAHDAKRLVTLRLLVQQYIKDNEISVTDEDVNNVVVDMSSMYEDPAEYLRWYYEDSSRVNNARAIAMENKVLDQILSLVKTKDVEISYDDLIKLSI